MYALLATLSAASMYVLFILLPLHQESDVPGSARLPGWKITVGYVLLCAAGLYTQYTFPFVLLVHNVFFAVWWLARGRLTARRWSWIALWAALQLAIVLLYVPWLGIALRSVTGWSAAGGDYVLGDALRDMMHVLTTGFTLPVNASTPALVIAGLLVIMGLWNGHPEVRRRRGLMGGLALGLWITLPVALILAFHLYKPAYLKFLIVALSPIHVLAAHGIENLACVAKKTRPRAVRCLLGIGIVALIVVLVVPVFQSLYNLYCDPAYARDDYRQIARDISAVSQPGDAIVLNAPNQWEVFTYYYPDRDVYPAPYRPDAEQVVAFLAPLQEEYRRLFVLYWGDAESDPERLVESWLAENAYLAGDRWYGNVRLATYGLAPLPDGADVMVDAEFGGGIWLQGYALGGESFAPGDVLPVTLFWQAIDATDQRYKVTVQVLDAAGQLEAQHDAEPGGGFRPTDTWVEGEVIVDRSGVALPSNLSAGRYTLIVGVYHAYSGERLVTQNGGDHVVLQEVVVR